MHLVATARELGTRALLVIRWWFGTTYVVAGIAGVVAAPIMIAFGNWGGVFMVVGGAVVAVVGWIIHPWGLQRRERQRVGTHA
jgi:predicted membrane channel-forming protein YqfA (hemolysin III family)